MDTNKMREQFEAAAKARWPSNPKLLLRINQPGTPAYGDYENPIVHHAWWAWQASREAVVVVLPDPNEVHDSGDYCAEAIDAIEAHGLKVAP